MPSKVVGVSAELASARISAARHSRRSMHHSHKMVHKTLKVSIFHQLRMSAVIFNRHPRSVTLHHATGRQWRKFLPSRVISAGPDELYFEAQV